MPRLFRSECRKGQWNRALNYQSIVKRASLAQCCITTCLLLCAVYGSYRLFFAGRVARTVAEPLYASHSSSVSSSSSAFRHLLATGSSSDNLTYYDKYCNRLPSKPNRTHIAWETCEFEQATGNHAGWVTLYVILTLIVFVAIAIICDDFFVPSLEAISEKLSLSEDVAGATFMAAGSSAPELFSSVAAVSFDSDAGVGTIAGSAVFNLLVIISLTAAFAGRVLHLDWRPLVRDSVWYALSIIVFIIMVSDTLIQIWEAVILLVLYALYIVIMVFNKRLMDLMAKIEQKCCCNKVSPDEEAESGEQQGAESVASLRSSQPLRQYHHDRRNSVLLNLHGSRHSLRGEATAPEANGRANGAAVAQNGKLALEKDEGTHSVRLDYSDVIKSNPSLKDDDAKSQKSDKSSKKDDKDEEEEEENPRIKCCGPVPDIRGAPPQRNEKMSCKEWLIFILKWIIFVVAFPFLVLFSWTIPECSRPDLKKYFLISFIVSVLWIAGLSFAMITVVARMGCLLGINTFVMALVVLAAGTSIPDLLSSIIVAKDGYGDMAISNAIGSNVFDIDLGLGLPFLIRLCVSAADPLDMFSDTERRAHCEGTMYVMPHVKFGAILGGLLVLCLAVIAIARFRLGKIIGISFFLFYLVFLTYAFVQEFACEYSC